jgi:hypothetical protein
MNGTIIDIKGITTNITPVELEDSTDKSYLITISDGNKEITITIAYEKICSCIVK